MCLEGFPSCFFSHGILYLNSGIIYHSHNHIKRHDEISCYPLVLSSAINPLIYAKKFSQMLFSVFLNTVKVWFWRDCSLFCFVVRVRIWGIKSVIGSTKSITWSMPNLCAENRKDSSLKFCPTPQTSKWSVNIGWYQWFQSFKIFHILFFCCVS